VTKFVSIASGGVLAYIAGMTPAPSSEHAAAEAHARHPFPRERPHPALDFDLPDSRFAALELNGTPWRVYDNANFSVHLGEACNGACGFCIAQLRYVDEGLAYAKPSLAVGPWAARLERVLAQTAAVRPSVSITGGEPTLHPFLPTALRVLAAAGVRKRTMTTNGTGLADRVPGSSDTVLDRLIAYRLEHLNISRAHYDHATNLAIMKLPADRLAEAELAALIAAATAAGIRVRLSCALLRDGIADADAVERYLDWAEAMGCESVIFRQLMDFDRERARGAIPEFCRHQTVELPALRAELARRPRFSPLLSVLGYYYQVEILLRTGAGGATGLTVASEMADLRLIDPQIARFSARLGAPCAFEMVYHPNGNLCAGWIESQRIMLEQP